MTITIDNETEFDFNFDYEKLIRDVIIYCLDYAECPYEAEVNVVLTTNEEIRSINKEYRDIDRPTDVLSFPLLEYDTPGDFEVAESETEDCFHPETGELMLGDIIISTEKVVEQAENYGHSKERELAFLVAHSMLHLFGYDHMEEAEQRVMEEKQEEILNDLKIFR